MFNIAVVTERVSHHVYVLMLLLSHLGYLVCFTRRITEVYVSSRVEPKTEAVQEPTPR